MSDKPIDDGVALPGDSTLRRIYGEAYDARRFDAACAAMTGMLAASAFPTTDECRANVVAHSLRYADDLLAALAQPPEGK